MKPGDGDIERLSEMIAVGRKRRQKRGITYFGLKAHEVALLKSTMECAPELAGDYELRDPNHADTCDIIVVNQDSNAATSWWKSLKLQKPSTMPVFLCDSTPANDDNVYCKRPFSPSFLQAALEDVLRQTKAPG